MNDFKQLTIQAQTVIKDALQAFNKCYLHINKKTGEYTAVNHTALTNCESLTRILGTYKSKDVFNKDELTLNYVNCFRQYPINYKGKRDYILLQTDWNIAKLDTESNLIFK